MLRWSIEKIELPLKYTWKISRNASESKSNLLVTVTDGTRKGRGEAAPNIRYDETPEKLLGEFDLLRAELEEGTNFSGEDFRIPGTLSCSQALRFAIESAWVHYVCSTKNIPVYQFLKLAAPHAVPTAYTIPIMEPGEMKAFYEEQQLQRFRYIKLKVGKEAAEEAVTHLAAFCLQPMIVDANEAFTDPDTCIRWMEKIKGCPIEFIEQPMPASMHAESLYLKRHSVHKIFADESITFNPDFHFLATAFDGINMKLMKAGGYFNGLNILKEARKHNLETMIGCMVETSLGISSALHLSSLAGYADLDSFLLLKEEPFQLVREDHGRLHLS